MALYEHVLLARPDISQQQADALVDQFTGIIKANGGRIGKIENWGLRPLTYRINKNRKAYYTLVNIDAPTAAVAEMERQMRINEDVLRFLTTRVDEHEEGQSAILSRRDDRREVTTGRAGRVKVVLIEVTGGRVARVSKKGNEARDG